jgi:alpha-ketoglutarate-dependent 2,4-dichlorophenoxyacetate dioxygenase
MVVYPVTESFAAEIGDVDLAQPLSTAQLAEIEAAFNRYAVLIFPDQQLSQEQHLAFARNFGPLETSVHAARKDAKLRLRADLGDISNLDPGETIWGQHSRRRLYEMANRLWHSDSSFKRTPAKASLLYAHVIPPVGGQTEYADMRAAYDALPDALKQRLRGLVAEHAIMFSRKKLGFEDFSEEERRAYPPVPQTLLRRHPGSGGAVPRLARRAHLRHARGRRPRAVAAVDRPRDAAPVRLHPSLARARPGDVGQPLHHASRQTLRRPALDARDAPRHHVGRGADLRAGRDR